ncbi:hypothetical protein [Bradyrhizobium embrapense]|uniref:hypothetical protein n=1 Tax=Bradyrhizobium embrapense TaxID=630921 RepID=UPI000A853201|nr:hypothetical protein [Bradyrhizobium embrapense]
MNQQNFVPFNVTAWSQVQHEVSNEPRAGEGGQEGFEQQLAEASQAAPAAPKRANRDDHPHLSQDDRDLIDNAIAQRAAQRNLSPSSASIYTQALRKLVNDLRARGQTTSLKDHQSLIDHVNTYFSNPSTRSTMLVGLNALGAYLDPARSRYPHLSEEEQDLIDKAIAQWAAQTNLRPKTAGNYTSALRQLVNDFRARGQTTDLGDHQSLVHHVNTYFSNFPVGKTMLAGLNALGAYLDPAYVACRAGRPTIVPSAADAQLLDRLDLSGLTTNSVALYDSSFRRFSKALNVAGHTISGLDDAARIEFARKLFPRDRNLVPALKRVRDAEHDSGAGASQEPAGHAVPSPELDGVPEKLWLLFYDEAEESATDPSELERLENELRGEIQKERDDRPVQPPFLTFNPEEFPPVKVRRLLDDQPAQPAVPVSPKDLNTGAGVLTHAPLHELERQSTMQQSGHEQTAALIRSSVLPSEDSRPTSLVIDTDHYTALFVPAGMTRLSTPLYPPNAASEFGSRSENAPQPSALSGKQASPALPSRRMEQAAPASDRAEAVSRALGEIFDASLSVDLPPACQRRI